ncbi:MAG: ABC transporter permease [Actinomycetota bacterium]|nr:ABC transporter permease [Actinomycetota bacterium]
MRSYFIRRLGYSLVTLLILSATIFGLVRLTGDPAILLTPEGATEEERAAIRADLGTDKSIPVQFVKFMGDTVTLDFGKSFNLRQPVSELYFNRLPKSLLLVSSALLFALLVGIPAGIISAVYDGRWMDHASKGLALTGMSIPGFVLGLTMMYYFSVQLGWLPTNGIGTWKHLLMPAIALGWYFAASTLRLVRSSMLDVLSTDFVKLARLKGLPKRQVMLRHAFRNVLIPLITLTGVNFVVLINAATVVEVVFVWPGLGSLLLEGILQRDFPLVQGVVIMAGVVIVAANFVVDMLYAWVDPRIRLAK